MSVLLPLAVAGGLALAGATRRGSRGTTAPLVLWHGAQRWEGPPEIRPARTGSVEHGPGLYLTTSVSTARKYAKGGGSVVRVEVDPKLGWLEDARLDAGAMVAFLRERPRLRKRAQIEADIERAVARMGRANIPAAVLLNLMVNHEALTGEHGPALAAFYVRHGIHASHVHQGDEDWIVLFDARRIRSWRKVPAGEAEDAPRVVRARGSSAKAAKGTQALVVVHLASLDSYYGQVDRKKPVLALADRLADAVERHDGPVVVVSQDWPTTRDSGPRRVVEDAAAARRFAGGELHRLHHDESEGDGGWDDFEREIVALLRKLGVERVKLAGLWYSKDGESGCVVETKQRLLRAGFGVVVDKKLVGYEENL